MTNQYISEYLYNKIVSSESFLDYKNRWKNKRVFYCILLFLFSLCLIYAKSVRYIESNVSLNPLFILNVLAFLILFSHYYKTSHDNVILKFYSLNKNNLNHVELHIIETYIKHLLKNNSIFENKKEHFLKHTQEIISFLNTQDKEEIANLANLENF